MKNEFMILFFLRYTISTGAENKGVEILDKFKNFFVKTFPGTYDFSFLEKNYKMLIEESRKSLDKNEVFYMNWDYQESSVWKCLYSIYDSLEKYGCFSDKS